MKLGKWILLYFFVNRFLLAIDRRNSIETAAETIRLAEEYRAKSGGIVVGVDLSGDPKVRLCGHSKEK